MTSPTERAIAAIVRILAVAAVDGADPDWTARQIMTGLAGHGWRHTQAGRPPDWRTPGSDPIRGQAVHDHANLVRQALTKPAPEDT